MRCTSTTTAMVVKRITTAQQMLACFPVMRQLRPHLIESEFVERVRRQGRAGFRLAGAFGAGEVYAVAGYRVSENLFRGCHLYVDDLVTAEHLRSQGVGKLLLEWLIAEARRKKCQHLVLDSGVQRFAAHRFYLRHGMSITAHHFTMEV